MFFIFGIIIKNFVQFITDMIRIWVGVAAWVYCIPCTRGYEKELSMISSWPVRGHNNYAQWGCNNGCTSGWRRTIDPRKPSVSWFMTRSPLPITVHASDKTSCSVLFPLTSLKEKYLNYYYCHPVPLKINIFHIIIFLFTW